MSTDLVGAGWGFPIEAGEDGSLAATGGERRIVQSIWLILGTALGERVMRPEYGCGVYEHVFAVSDAHTASAVESAVRDALVLFEPRIETLEVHAAYDPGERGLLNVEIEYRIRSSNHRFNLVYPLYLEEPSR